jgi:hypothetical protein
MDKQEMVRCPVEGVCYKCRHQKNHSKDKCGNKSLRCPPCVPVEPAQPELPREKSISLELDEIFSGEHRVLYNCEAVDAYLATATINGFIKAILPLCQQAKKEGYKKGVEDNYNMGQIDLEQALKRIAELEAIEAQHRKLNGELRVEINSLKEQLAVLSKGIPAGAHCGGCRALVNHPYLVAAHCFYTEGDLQIEPHTYHFMKHAGCPVPAPAPEPTG